MSSSLSASLFPAFFEALWGYAPFDWQTRLLAKVHENGWPRTLDLPTGSGKTATLDVALFALALDASRPAVQRLQPRRIVLVVDRRVVVDQGYERAVAIANSLEAAKDGILADVAKALRELSGDSGALPVLPAVLRGGMPRESEWAKSPSQPVIMTSTVDQVGSRLLFRGYGVSERMRSIHAGLLGCDTLLLLDEVHLARPFEETLRALTERYSKSSEEVRPLTFVRMSATVADASENTFRLEDADRANPFLNERLAAKKRAVLRQVNAPRDPVKAGEAITKAAVKEAQRLGKGTPRAVAIIVNRVETARKIASLAQTDMAEDWSVRLLTGRMRPLDRLDRQAAILEQVVAGRTRSPNSPKLLLVSTQAIEAGADFDFDALITECASLDALRQRFGRLDRLGKLGETEAVVLAASSAVDEKAEDDPIYGAALRRTWHWLNSVGTPSSELDAPVVDFGIDALDACINTLGHAGLEELAAPRATAPILTSSHLDRWAQTSPAPHADPEVGPFLHGLGRSAPEVQIVWRADVTTATLEAVTAEGSEEVLSELEEMLELVRPSSLEALSVPLWTAKRWLAEVYARQSPAITDGASIASPGLADVEGQPEVEIETTNIAPALFWRGDKLQPVRTIKDLRPGATLIVPSEYGGLDAAFDSWDPESTIAVRDRGDEAHLLQRGRAVLRWSPAVIASWVGSAPEAVRKGPRVTKTELDDDGALAERRAFQEWQREAIAVPDLPEWAKVALAHLELRPVTKAVGSSKTPSSGEASSAWRVTQHPRPIAKEKLRLLFKLPALRRAAPTATSTVTTEGDDGSFLGSVISLSEHLRGVQKFARKFGESLHLSSKLTEDLALAGWLHDLGKADPRFQLLLHAGDPVREAAAPDLIAKSSLVASDQAARERARERSGYPKGMRHELLSVALVEKDEQLRQRADNWDLVLHLVGSHHGWCRPFAPPVHDPEPQVVTITLEGTTWSASSAHELGRFDSTVAERYWSLTRKYGYWGLAWLEAILRLADHRESEYESAKENG